MVEKESEDKNNSIPLTNFQLVDIRIHEIIARRCDPESEKAKPVPISIELSSYPEKEITDEFSSILTFKAGFPLEGMPTCSVELSIEGIFNISSEDNSINQDELRQFMSSDIIVLFWPYLRQYLHDITEKMRLGTTLLPIIDPRALVDVETNISD